MFSEYIINLNVSHEFHKSVTYIKNKRGPNIDRYLWHTNGNRQGFRDRVVVNDVFVSCYSSKLPFTLGQQHPSHTNVICLIQFNGLTYEMLLINLKIY